MTFDPTRPTSDFTPDLTPDLTVVIPTIGREIDCHRAIESVELLRRQTGLRVELVVVEQGDQPAYRVPAGFSDRWVFSRLCSTTHARNAGLDLARAPVVMFLDDDARVSTGAVALLEEWRSSGAPMVCGRMCSPDGTIVRGGDRRVVVRGWSAWRYFAEPAALWDVAALRDIGGFDERIGPPHRLGAEDGALMLGRLASAGHGCGVFVPVDLSVHPPFVDVPPAKARRYGQGTSGALVLAPNRWYGAYAVASGLRRCAGLAVAVLRRDGVGARHRAAWLSGFFTGFAVGIAERRRPRRQPPELVTIVPADEASETSRQT